MDVLYILLLVIFYLNVVATYHVLHVETLEKEQITYQLAIVWLIPIIGSVIISGFHLSDKDYIRAQKQKQKQKPTNSLINMLVLITFFRAGSSGDLPGIHDTSGNSFNGFDSGGDGGEVVVNKVKTYKNTLNIVRY